MNCTLTMLLAAQVLFPSADAKPEGYDGAQVRVEDGVAVTDVAPNHNFSGVNFVFPAPFALNRYDIWRAEVSNRTDRTLNFTAANRLDVPLAMPCAMKSSVLSVRLETSAHQIS